MPPRFSKIMLGAALGATMLTAAQPAQAGRAVAGIAGLAVGAGLVAAAHANRDQWYRDNNRDLAYDDNFYRTRGYYPTDGYYASRYSDYPGCSVERRYDPYTDRPVQIRTCY